MRSFEWFREGISTSWRILNNNLALLIKLVVIVVGVSLGMQLLMGLIAGSPNDQPSIFTSIVMSVLSVVAALVSLSLDAGIDRILLNLVDGKITSLNQLLVSGKTVFNILIATLLFSLLLFVGFLLFFIPGIYFALKYSQFQYAIIDKNMGPIEALKESARLTKGKKLTLIGFGLFALLFNLLGLLMLFVGVIVTGAITTIAGVWLYRKLDLEAGR